MFEPHEGHVWSSKTMESLWTNILTPSPNPADVCHLTKRKERNGISYLITNKENGSITCNLSNPFLLLLPVLVQRSLIVEHHHNTPSVQKNIKVIWGSSKTSNNQHNCKKSCSAWEQPIYSCIYLPYLSLNA